MLGRRSWQIAVLVVQAALCQARPLCAWVQPPLVATRRQVPPLHVGDDEGFGFPSLPKMPSLEMPKLPFGGDDADDEYDKMMRGEFDGKPRSETGIEADMPIATFAQLFEMLEETQTAEGVVGGEITEMEIRQIFDGMAKATATDVEVTGWGPFERENLRTTYELVDAIPHRDIEAFADRVASVIESKRAATAKAAAKAATAQAKAEDKAAAASAKKGKGVAVKGSTAQAEAAPAPISTPPTSEA